MLEAGADRDKRTTVGGKTPLHGAALYGHVGVVRILLEFGADKEKVTTDGGATPLALAVKNGHLEVQCMLR